MILNVQYVLEISIPNRLEIAEIDLHFKVWTDAKSFSYTWSRESKAEPRTGFTTTPVAAFLLFLS